MRQVLGVLAGTDMSLEQLARICQDFDFIIAADGAANRLMEIGVSANVVVGDLDSATPEALAFAQAVEKVSDQNFSDCDKLLAYASACDFGQITVTNVEGDQPDHFLGTLSSCARSVVDTRLIFRSAAGVVLRGPVAHVVELNAPHRVSLLPLTDCAGVTLAGVRWPLGGVEMSALGQVSLSNESVDPTVRVEIVSGAVLLTWSSQVS